jgi:23S rRNA (pseudouridine1915-N3)-methyltransferase
MRISINSICKTKSSDPENILIQEYLKRTKWDIRLKEVFPKKSFKDEASQKLQESSLLLENTKNSHIVALDERGEICSSEEFADFLRKLQVQGISDITFCIGGASGHHPSLLNTSSSSISLGKMTLPHKIARLVLVEQLYRAETIINNHPYHK